MDKLNEETLEGLLSEVLVGQHGTQTTEPVAEPQDPAGIHALLQDFPPQPTRPQGSSTRATPAPAPIAAVPMATVAGQPAAPGGQAQHFIMSGISKDNPSVWAGMFPPPQHSRRYRKFMKDERKQWEKAKTPQTPPPGGPQATTAPLVDLQPTDIIESNAQFELLHDAMLGSQSTGSVAPSPKNRSQATTSSQSNLSMTRHSGTLGSGTLTSPLVPGLGHSSGSLQSASATALTVETPTAAAVARAQYADPWGSSIVSGGSNLPPTPTAAFSTVPQATTGFASTHTNFGVAHLLTPPPPTMSAIAPRMAFGNHSLTGTPAAFSISPKANNSISTMGNSSTTTAGSTAQTPTHFALDFLKGPPHVPPPQQPAVVMDQPFAMGPASYQPASRQLAVPTGQKLPPPAYPLETAVHPSPPSAQIATASAAPPQPHYAAAAGTPSTPTVAHNGGFPAHRSAAPMPVQHTVVAPAASTYTGPQRYVPVQQPQQIPPQGAPTYYMPSFAGPTQPNAAPAAPATQAPQSGQGQQVVFVFLQPQPQLQSATAPLSAQHPSYQPQPQPQPQLQQPPQQHLVYRTY